MLLEESQVCDTHMLELGKLDLLRAEMETCWLTLELELVWLCASM